MEDKSWKSIIQEHLGCTKDYFLAQVDDYFIFLSENIEDKERVEGERNHVMEEMDRYFIILSQAIVKNAERIEALEKKLKA